MSTSALEGFITNLSLRNADNKSLFDVQKSKADAEKLKTAAKKENDVEGFGEFLARQFSIPTKATKDRVANNNARRQLLYDSVVNRYGGKDKIPASVLKAMDIGKFSLKAVGDREVVTSGKPLTDRRIGIVQAAIIAADEEAAQVRKFTGVGRDRLMASLGLKSTDEIPPRLKTLLLTLAGRPDLVRSGGGVTPQMAQDLVAVRTELLALRRNALVLERVGADRGVVGGNTLTFGDFRVGFALTGNGRIRLSLSSPDRPEGRAGLGFEVRETNADKTLDRIEMDIADNVALYGTDTAMDVLKSAGAYKKGWPTDESLRAREVGTKILSSATGAKTSEFASCGTSLILMAAEKALRGMVRNPAGLVKFMQGVSAKNLTNDAETLKLYEQLNRSLENDAQGVAEKVKMSPDKALEAGEEAILAKAALFELRDLDERIEKNESFLEGLKLSAQKAALKRQLPAGEFKLTAEDVKDREAVEKQAAAILRRREAAELRGAIADVIFEADTGGADLARLDVLQHAGARFGEAMKRNKAAFVKLIANPEKFDLLPEEIREPMRSALESQFAKILPKEALPEGGFKLEDMRGVFEKQTGISSKGNVLGKDFDKFEIFVSAQLDAFLDKCSELKKVDSAFVTGFAEIEKSFEAAVENGANEIQKRVTELFGAALPGVGEKGEAKPPKAKDLVDEVVKGNQKLGDLVSSSATDLKSGQGAFTKTVLSTYFKSLSDEDRRAMFATMLRFAPPPDPKDLDVKDLFTKQEREDYNLAEQQGDKDRMESLVNARKTAHEEETKGRLLGALLKGTGPLLLKMLQGMPMPKDNRIMSIALADMKSNLAPIPEKAVQANLLDVVERSKGEIKSIAVTKSLGAASVGQAFLCRVTLNRTDGETGRPVEKDVVVKMLRPDVKNRLTREKTCFLKAADSVSGMAETFRGQLERIMDELDLTVEARNVLDGIRNYGDGTFGNLDSMRLDPIVPSTSNVMILEKAPGTTLDRYVKDVRETIANVRAPCVQSVDEKTGKATYRYPGLDTYMEMRKELVKSYADLLQKRDMLESLSLKWVSEGLYGSGFYHGDLHSGNMMVDGETNKLTVIDFGNVTKLTKDQQSAIMKMMAAAAGGKGCEDLFVEGYRSLLSPAGKTALDKDLGEIRRLLSHLFADEVGGAKTSRNDVGQRIAAALMQLQRLGLELPGPVYNFSQCQIRLQNAVDDVNGLMRTIRETMVAPLMADAGPQAPKDDIVGRFLRNEVPKLSDDKANESLLDEFASMFKDMATQEDRESYEKNDTRMTDETEKAKAEGEGWVAYLMRTRTLFEESPTFEKLKEYLPKSKDETQALMRGLVSGAIPSLDPHLEKTFAMGRDEKVRQLLAEAKAVYAAARDKVGEQAAFDDETVKAKTGELLDAYVQARNYAGFMFLSINTGMLKSELGDFGRELGFAADQDDFKALKAGFNRLDGDEKAQQKFLESDLFDFIRKIDRLREDGKAKKAEIYKEFMRGGKIMKEDLKTFSDHVSDVIGSNIGSSVWQLGLGNAIWYGDKLRPGQQKK